MDIELKKDIKVFIDYWIDFRNTHVKNRKHYSLDADNLWYTWNKPLQQRMVDISSYTSFKLLCEEKYFKKNQQTYGRDVQLSYIRFRLGFGIKYD